MRIRLVKIVDNKIKFFVLERTAKPVKPEKARECEMDDYILLVIRWDGFYHTFHLTKEQAESGKWDVFKYRGFRYSLDTDKAYKVHGWTPWIKRKWTGWWYPWSYPIEMANRFVLRVGLLVYREPLPKPETVPPTPPTLINPTLVGELRGYTKINPRMFRTLTLSPLYKEYRKKQSFHGKKSQWFWIMVGLLLIVFIMWVTGVIHIE